MRQVDYTKENVGKCWCGQCPVQVNSECAKELYERSTQSEEMPPPSEMPGLYCATGKATCEDIAPVQRCYCPQCLIWAEYGLHGNHFCVLGTPDLVHEMGKSAVERQS